MAAISAAQVKELRERTGAGMMECKNALEATQGDIALAIEELRKKGRAKADKKAGRTAAEGVIVIRLTDDHTQGILLEVNSETDFVARDANFIAFANAVAETAIEARLSDVDALMTLPLKGHAETVEEARQTLVAKVGENVRVRRVMWVASEYRLGMYLHGSRIGVLVQLNQDQPELAKDIAMHIAASKPLVISPDEVPATVIEKEKEIFLAQAESSGKSQEIIEKMVVGRIKKFLDEVSLLGQPFVKDPEMTVSQLLARHSAKVLSFVRFEVGEGIEKETDNFVEAVMSQVKGSST